MIDIHCHILPELDDGSSCMEESLCMARMAADTGVQGIVATPHFRGEAASLRELGAVVERLEALRAAIAGEKISITLYPGAEILCLPETPYLGAHGRLPTISDSDYLLIEFYFDESASFINETLAQLTAQGYLPVIAHPERYAAVRRDPSLAEGWFFRNCVLQINKGSILGAFGAQVQRTAEKLLYAGLAHVIASDAHRADFRTTHMTALRERLEDCLGRTYTGILLDENPRRMVAGKPMVSP